MLKVPFDPDATFRALSAGQRVLGQRYTLARVLGRGGMGIVWLAEDETLKDQVALKFLPEAVIHDSSAIHDLKQETQRSLRLTHSNIVRIHGFIEDGERAAISMEYVEGVTLAKRRIEQPGAVLTPEALLPIIRQIADALEYAHNRAKVVHRDLKPANFLISKVGEVKIADFGISATLTDTATRFSQREQGSGGSPPYMSPQQMLGGKPCISDDIYALGATLYELLTSKPPFHTGNLAIQAQTKIPPPLQQRRAELLGPAAANLPPIPERWEKTIAACLAKDPADRPASVSSILRSLENLSVAQPSAVPLRKSARAVTRPASPATGLKKRAWLWPAVLLFVLLLGFAAWFGGLSQSWGTGPDTLLELEARPGTEVTAKTLSGEIVSLGLVPSEGKLLVSRKLEPGTYALSLRHVDCEPATVSAVALSAGNSALVIGIQKPLPATLSVVTLPPGAEISVQGKTPVTSPALLASLPSETSITVEAFLPQHRGQSAQVTLKPGENRILTFPAFVADGNIVRLQIAPPEALGPSLSAQVDGVAAAIKAGELQFLASGDRTITLDHPDYSRWEGRVPVRSEGATPLAVNLSPKPGSVSLTTTPTGAAIRIKLIGPLASELPVISQSSPANIRLAAGEYLVQCSLPGYNLTERRIKISANKELALAVALEVQRGPSVGQPWTIPGLGLTILPLASGEFDQGSPDGEVAGDSIERPILRTVIAAPYWLGQHEITVGQWDQVMQDRADSSPSALPKTEVSYTDALAFLDRLNTREAAAERLPTGYLYSLPTEDQWEYACRAGTQSPFSHGSRLDSTHANFDTGLPYGGGAPARPSGTPLPVGSFPANSWGFRDMHGNVWEWCLNVPVPYTSSEPSVFLPVASGVAERAARGGAWNSPGHRCRSATRLAVPENARSSQLGFRVALVPMPEVKNRTQLKKRT
jgi:formylglycine-generating enzyme required for sulfatase activity